MAGLAASDLATIQRASDVISSFSLIGSLSIIAAYARYPALREKSSFRLILCLSLSDTLNHIFDFIGPSPDSLAAMAAGTRATDAQCYAQALGNAEFELSSVMWTSVIAAVLWAQVTRAVRPERIDRAFRYLSLFAWGVPAALALLPLAAQGADVYGASGSWCWLRAPYAGWIFGVFYIPLWCCMIFNVFVHVSIKRKLESMAASGALTDAATAARLAAVIERLKYYPFVLIVVWLPASVSRIVEATLGHQVFALVLFHRIFSSSQGLLNAIAYGLSRAVREALHEDAFRLAPGCVPPPAQQLREAALTESTAAPDAPALAKG